MPTVRRATARDALPRPPGLFRGGGAPRSRQLQDYGHTRREPALGRPRPRGSRQCQGRQQSTWSGTCTAIGAWVELGEHRAKPSQPMGGILISCILLNGAAREALFSPPGHAPTLALFKLAAAISSQHFFYSLSGTEVELNCCCH